MNTNLSSCSAKYRFKMIVIYNNRYVHVRVDFPSDYIQSVVLKPVFTLKVYNIQLYSLYTLIFYLLILNYFCIKTFNLYMIKHFAYINCNRCLQNFSGYRYPFD